MDMNHMLAGGITVAKLTELETSLANSFRLVNDLLSVLSIYSYPENYTKGLDHQLAEDFIRNLKEKGQLKVTGNPEPEKTPSKFKPKIVK
jgi:hypothetical protein